MARSRGMLVSLATILVVASPGCDRQQGKAVVESIVRPIAQRVADEIGGELFLQEFGPMILTNIIGASTPTSGPPVLNGLCANAGWRVMMSRATPGTQFPWPLDFRDPSKQIRVRTIK